MVFTALLAASALAQTPFAERFEIPVKNVCASYLLGRNVSRDDHGGVEDQWKRLAPAFDLSADDAKNVVVALGPAESIGELKRIVAMFDVAPMRLRLKVRVEVPRFGLDSTSSVTQGNNQQHVFSEPAVGFEATVIPRINDDGTVNLFVETVHRGRRDRTTGKVRVGDTLRVKAQGPATWQPGVEGPEGSGVGAGGGQSGQAHLDDSELGASVTITVEGLIERKSSPKAN